MSQPGPRFGRYVFLPMALAVAVYSAIRWLASGNVVVWATLGLMAVMVTSVVTFRVLEARHARRIRAGLAEPDLALGQVWARLRRRPHR